MTEQGQSRRPRRPPIKTIVPIVSAAIGFCSLVFAIVNVGLRSKSAAFVTAGALFLVASGAALSYYIKQLKRKVAQLESGIATVRSEQQLSSTVGSANISEEMVKLQEHFDRTMLDLRRQHTDSVEAVHKYIHTARDNAVEFVQNIQALIAQPRKRRNNADAELDRQLRHLRGQFLKALLPKIIDIFRPMFAADCRLWVAIREIRNDPDGKKATTHFFAMVTPPIAEPIRERSLRMRDCHLI